MKEKVINKIQSGQVSKSDLSKLKIDVETKKEKRCKKF